MGQILLKNSTGRRRGSYVRYEFGQDLFGFHYLNVARGRRHREALLRSEVFADPREFLFSLDIQLDRHETLNYVRPLAE